MQIVYFREGNYLTIVEVSNVTKYYDKNKILDNLTLRIPENRVVGLLGSNGAGKTTLLKIIAGITQYSKGLVKVCGKEHKAQLDKIGYIPETIDLYPYFTGREFLEFVAGLREIEARKVKSIIEKYKNILQLPNLEELIETYSKGNKEKILFISSIIHNPKLLVLDEPFTGIDPLIMKALKIWIKDYIRNGGSIILSTHILERAADLCDSIIIINNGSILDRYENISKNYIEIEDKYVSIIKE